MSKSNESLTFTTKYKYTQFDSLIEQGNYNFYGVITDSTFPLEEPGTSKYSCILKLIDKTTNYISNPKDFDDKIIYLIIKSEKKENMPFVKHIGDIIRIHYGLYAPKKRRNVYLNLSQDKNNNIGDYCLYDITDNKYIPYNCSGDKYAEEEQDKEIIDGIKKWEKEYLCKKNSLVYNLRVKLGDRNKEGNDKDLIVFVTKKVILNDQLVLFIQDESDGCELHTYKFFDYVKENDVIRIRKYKLFDNNNIVINEEGNIMIIPKESHCYEEMINGLSKKLKQIKG